MNTLRWWLLRRRLRSIQLLVLDVDGVLTDGGLWFDAAGQLSKRFDVRDGLGIRLLQQAGLHHRLSQWWPGSPQSQRRCGHGNWASTIAWWASRTSRRPHTALQNQLGVSVEQTKQGVGG